jgi:hypothetical protein
MWVFYNLLAISSALHAAFVAFAPIMLLTSAHGDLDAAKGWWDSYFLTEPRIHQQQDVQCADGIGMSVLASPAELFRGADEIATKALFDPMQPLCLGINFNWYGLQDAINASRVGSGFAAELLRLGIEKVSFKPSGMVEFLAAQVLLEIPRLREGYGMVHVRRGDKGTPECTSPAYVKDRIQHLESLDGAGFPPKPHVWVVMSNGGEAWFRNFTHFARSAGIDIIVEGDLESVVHLRDNFLRYAVLQHLYGGAHRVLYTYKPMRLRPNKANQVFLTERLCGDRDEPTVPFADGGKTLAMSTSSCSG